MGIQNNPLLTITMGLALTGLGVVQQVTSANAANFIDQNQPINQTFLALFFNSDLAQSFQTQQNNVSGAGIVLEQGTRMPSGITISLWDNLPNAGGVQLATATSTSPLTGGGAFEDLFWNPVTVTPGQSYFLIFTSDANVGGLAGASDLYPNGIAYANSGYGPFPVFDYTFRTYSSDLALVSVPESQPINMLGLTIGGSFLGIYRLLKNRKQNSNKA